MVKERGVRVFRQSGTVRQINRNAPREQHCRELLNKILTNPNIRIPFYGRLAGKRMRRLQVLFLNAGEIGEKRHGMKFPKTVRAFKKQLVFVLRRQPPEVQKYYWRSFLEILFGVDLCEIKSQFKGH